MGITIDQNHLKGFVEEKDVDAITDQVHKANQALTDKTGLGNDYLGWIDLPSRTEPKLLNDLIELGHHIRKHSECVVSIGIGGSYLGIRATEQFVEGADFPIYYAGHNMSADYMHKLLKVLKDKDFSVVMISKSGTTTEPALAFRLIRELMNTKYSKEEIQDRIVCVTDGKKGALRTIADEEGFKSYVIPDDVGGRFSILTPVGLVPLAIAGVDIKSLIAGAQEGQREYAVNDLSQNVAMQYAATRYLLYKKGKKIEVLTSFSENLYYVAEWWKQLFGESEGKNGKGIFPASTIYSTDLHSMGQLMQDGERTIFETFIEVEEPHYKITIPSDEQNLDDFNLVAGKDLDYVNKQGYKATAEAHYEGGVPNMTLTIGKSDAFHLGQLYYLFERAVGISGYLLEVNPFDQPGVEAYKKKMFALLGRK